MTKHLLKGGFYLFIFINMFLLLSACASSPEETMERIAKETRSSCPQVVDEYTTMIDSKVLPNRTLRMTYNVKGEYSDDQKREMTEPMKAVLIAKLKQRNEVEFYLVNNVRFEHLFLDSQNKTMMHIQIEATDYK